MALPARRGSTTPSSDCPGRAFALVDRVPSAAIEPATRCLGNPGKRPRSDRHERLQNLGVSRIGLGDDLVQRREVRELVGLISHVELQIEITFDLHAVRGVISAGRLTALSSGRADVTAELRCEGVRVTSATRQQELPIVIKLGSGVMLAEPPQR